MKCRLGFVSLLALCATATFAQRVPSKHYDLTITLNPDQRQMAVSGTVRIPSATKERKDVDILLAEQMSDLSLEVVSPPECSGPSKLLKLGSKDSQTVWRFTPRNPFPANKEVKVKLTYSGGSQTNFVFYIGPKGSFAGGPNTPWYPRFGKYTGEGASARFNDENSCLGMLHFDVPAGHEVVASGANIGQKSVGNRVLVDYEVRQPCAMSFAAGKYKVYQSPGSFPVSFYLLNEIENPQGYVDSLRKVVDTLSKICGPYPFPEFAVVEVDDAASGEAQFGGASMACFMLSDTSFLKGGFNLAFFGHEIGHQWWGNLVVNGGSNGGYMMDEALAQYVSLRAVELMESPLKAQEYRTIGYPNYVDSQCAFFYFMFAAAGYDHRLIDLPSTFLSHQLADSKGFYVYHMLRRQIGEKAFEEALQSITKKRRFSSITWEEFCQEVGKVSGQKLDWFWDQWMRRTGAPIIDMKWEQKDGKVTVQVSQIGEVYRLKMPIVMTYSDGSSEASDLDIRQQQQTFNLPAKKQLAKLELDPTMEILHLTPETKTKFEALKPYAKAWWMMNIDGKSIEGRKTLEDAIATFTGSDPYGAEFAVRSMYAGILFRTDKNSKAALEQMEKALRCTSRIDTFLPRIYVIYGEILNSLGEKDRARKAAETAIDLEAKTGRITHITGTAKALLQKISSSR